MFPPLEAGCDHQAGEEHALMHLPDPQVQNTDSIFHTRRQNWRDIMESYSSETTLLQTHATGAITRVVSCFCSPFQITQHPQHLNAQPLLKFIQHLQRLRPLQFPMFRAKPRQHRLSA